MRKPMTDVTHKEKALYESPSPQTLALQLMTAQARAY